jgi:DNA repair protein RadC
MRIKSLPKIDLPREKLEKYGPGKLADYELVAILLGSGIEGMNVLELSKKITKEIEKKGIDLLDRDDLIGMKGLGKAKASQLVAAFELGRRFLHGKRSSIALSPKEVWERLADIRTSKKEHFVAFYLDSREQEIKREIISIGILDSSLVHPREVFENAIRNNASAIIVAHNHPSGSLEPSIDDIEITKRLMQAGKLLGIELRDHVIITSESYSAISI